MNDKHPEIKHKLNKKNATHNPQGGRYAPENVSYWFIVST